MFQMDIFGLTGSTYIIYSYFSSISSSAKTWRTSHLPKGRDQMISKVIKMLTSFPSLPGNSHTHILTEHPPLSNIIAYPQLNILPRTVLTWVSRPLRFVTLSGREL